MNMKKLMIVACILCSAPSLVAEKQANEETTQNSTQKIAEKMPMGMGKECYLLDTIQAVVYSEEGAEIVTKSDIDRPGLDGSFRTLEDVVLERLMYLDAKRFKILPDQDTIDKHLKAVQRENN